MGEMFKKKIDALFISMSDVFGTANNILIAGFVGMGWGHAEMFEKVLPGMLLGESKV